MLRHQLVIHLLYSLATVFTVAEVTYSLAQLLLQNTHFSCRIHTSFSSCLFSCSPLPPTPSFLILHFFFPEIFSQTILLLPELCNAAIHPPHIFFQISSKLLSFLNPTKALSFRTKHSTRDSSSRHVSASLLKVGSACLSYSLSRGGKRKKTKQEHLSQGIQVIYNSRCVI